MSLRSRPVSFVGVIIAFIEKKKSFDLRESDSASVYFHQIHGCVRLR